VDCAGTGRPSGLEPSCVTRAPHADNEHHDTSGHHRGTKRRRKRPRPVSFSRRMQWTDVDDRLASRVVDPLIGERCQAQHDQHQTDDRSGSQLQRLQVQDRGDGGQLKDPKAIGFFTKITLKNQVDDLLDQFREYYQGKAKFTLKDLRRSYDLLMMKVLSLLQDEDQKLASAIVSSREAIWGLLADPKKFATLQD
jgi:hypothetical protein